MLLQENIISSFMNNSIKNWKANIENIFLLFCCVFVFLFLLVFLVFFIHYSMCIYVFRKLKLIKF